MGINCFFKIPHMVKKNIPLTDIIKIYYFAARLDGKKYLLLVSIEKLGFTIILNKFNKVFTLLSSWLEWGRGALTGLGCTLVSRPWIICLNLL